MAVAVLLLCLADEDEGDDSIVTRVIGDDLSSCTLQFDVIVDACIAADA